MDKYGGFLGEAAKEFNIWKIADESEESWKARVIYSVLGRMLLSSLWNSNDENELVSKTYVRHHIARIQEAYRALYPEEFKFFPKETGTLIEKLYLKTGFIYNLPGRFAPVAERTLCVGHLSLLRGCAMRSLPIGYSVWMSGLGPYRPVMGEDGEADAEGIGKAYRFQERTLPDFRDDLTQGIAWSGLEETPDAKYLRLAPPFTGSYWTDRPDKSGGVSVVRLGDPPYIFYLYHFENGNFEGYQLPGWMTASGEYRRIAISLMHERGTLPPIVYCRDRNGKAVRVKLGYLLPPAEQNFFELYSWPLGFRFLEGSFDRFNRLMTNGVFFHAFMPALKRIGYTFKETEEKI